MKKLALVLLPMLCSAASNTSLEALIDRARAMPGEFAADAAIRLANVEELGKPRRIELLLEASQRAGEAQEPLKRHSSIMRVAGPAGYLNRAYAQDLDGLSLRLRAIEAMLPLDPARARGMFLNLPPLQIPRVACSEFLVYDPSRYYAVLGQMGARDPLHLIEPRIQEITSPSQVEPVARMILETHTGDQDFRALVAALAGALHRIAGDDRAFTATIASTGPAILSLVEECRKRGLSPLPLIEAYRLYLVANLSGPRCADDDLMRPGAFAITGGQAGEPEGANAIAFFNGHIQTAPLQPIQDAEAASTKTEGSAEGLRGCQDSQCQAMANRFRALILDSSGQAFTAAQKATPEWEEKLRQCLSDLESWKEDAAGGAAEVYREKSGVYSDLLAIAPPGRMQELVVQATLDFVRRGEFQARNRMEWFLPANVLIGRMELEPLGIGKLLPRLRAVDDAVISLYLDLETVAPRGPGSVMPLL